MPQSTEMPLEGLLLQVHGSITMAPATMEMQGVVNCFGRISILIVQNTQAFHMIMSALLQLFDRSALLYVELARFALRLLGFRTKPRMVQPRASNGLPPPPENQQHLQGSKAAPSGPGDSV
ncbi:peroxisomal membrane protein 13 [Hevea brasiliensis]|uniref:peroxisomal membrane protein 13 n=1 Tax=Hevea brasiliensis TaxID=3981 RepID=UPI0025E84E5C|nr:peroxisomal membrane protein 13 [Hevea brasiliensis]